jgi:ABC-type long-subunit fatty acid transport system fused permease/ATPase subunit
MSAAAVIKLAFFYAAVLWCLVGTVLVLIGRLRNAG